MATKAVRQTTTPTLESCPRLASRWYERALVYGVAAPFAALAAVAHVSGKIVRRGKLAVAHAA